MLEYFPIVAVAVGWGAWQLIACIIWPFAHCRRCRGSGRRYAPSGGAFRDCGKCSGSGRRVRLGRRIWGAYRRQR